jgi:hypothetical protein
MGESHGSPGFSWGDTMKLENKNPERFIDGGERAVCSHVQAMRKTKGNNDCWIIGNDASGEVALRGKDGFCN